MGWSESEARHGVNPYEVIGARCDERMRDRVASKSWAILRYANGLYEGGVNPFTMRDGWQPCRNGRGVTLLGSGEKYEGEYVDDVKHGVGLQFWLNGDMFLGQWRQDHMSGKGCYYYGNGSTYVGEFAGGRRHGSGTLAWP